MAGWTEWLPLSVASVCGQTGDCVTPAGRRSSGPRLCGAQCECLHSTGCWALGAGPTPVNQEKKNQGTLLVQGSDTVGAVALKVRCVSSSLNQSVQYSLDINTPGIVAIEYLNFHLVL